MLMENVCIVTLAKYMYVHVIQTEKKGNPPHQPIQDIHVQPMQDIPVVC